MSKRKYCVMWDAGNEVYYWYEFDMWTLQEWTEFHDDADRFTKAEAMRIAKSYKDRGFNVKAIPYEYWGF